MEASVYLYNEALKEAGEEPWDGIGGREREREKERNSRLRENERECMNSVICRESNISEENIPYVHLIERQQHSEKRTR